MPSDLNSGLEPPRPGSSLLPTPATLGSATEQGHSQDEAIRPPRRPQTWSMARAGSHGQRRPLRSSRKSSDPPCVCPGFPGGWPQPCYCSGGHACPWGPRASSLGAAGRPPASHVRQPPRDSPASSPFRFDSGLLPLHVSRGRPTVPGGHQLLHRTRGSQGGLVGHTSGPLNGLPLTFDRSTPLSALLGEPCLKPNPTRLSSSTTLCAPFSSCLFRS